MAVITSGPGYNGVTGAKATYNPDEQMWVDTNGERIRTDAIVPGEPPAKAGSPAPAPTSPSAPPAASPGPGGVGGGGGDAGGGGGGEGLPASMMALASMGGSNSGGGAQSLPPSRAALNPNLGKRIYPQSMMAFARLGRSAY